MRIVFCAWWMAATVAAAQDVALGNDPPAVSTLAAAMVVPPDARCTEAATRFASAARWAARARRTLVPQFRGEPTTVRVSRWAVRAFVPALHRLARRSARAETALRAVIERGCVPWTIAAARAIGELDRRMIRELGLVPEASDMPPTLCRIDDGDWPLRMHAEEHFAHCHEIAVAHRWPSADALKCVAALSDLLPDRHPIPGEMVPDRAWSSDGVHLLPIAT